MTRVLLIMDIERVQRIFHALEDEGVLQLRTASTLALSDEELAAYRPDHIFAQSRISGFSSDLALRNLRKGVPPETRIVLLPVDEGDLTQARKQAKLFLSLGRDDAALAEGVRRMLNPEAHPAPHPSEAAEDAKPVLAGEGKREAAKKVRAGKAGVKAPASKAGAAAEKGELPPKAAPRVARRKSAGKAAQPAVPVVPEEKEPEPCTAAGEKPGGSATPTFGKAGWLAEEAPADLPVREPGRGRGEELAAEVQVAAPEKFAEIMRRAAAKQEKESAPLGAPPDPPQPVGPAEPSELSDRPDKSKPQPPEGTDAEPFPVEAPPFTEPETLANGRLHAGRGKSRWIMPLLLALLFVPVVYFATILLRQPLHKSPPAIAPAPATKPKPSRGVAAPTTSSGNRPLPTQPLPQAGQPQKPKPAPPAAAKVPPTAKPVPKVKPAPPAAQAPALPTPGTPTPGRQAAAKPAAGKPTAAKQSSVPAPPAARPAAKAGLKALPPFMAGVKADPSYAGRHPGWQRFLGARGEYKIYREGGVYRALQIIALPGQSIPDDIYQRSLLEFGGIDSYRVQSSERKGNLLIEHGEAKGGVGVIVYRKLKDQSLKGLVIYYH